MQGLLSCKTRTDTLLTAQTDTLCPHQRTLSVRTDHAGLPHPTSFHVLSSFTRTIQTYALSLAFLCRRPDSLTDFVRPPRTCTTTDIWTLMSRRCMLTVPTVRHSLSYRLKLPVTTDGRCLYRWTDTDSTLYVLHRHIQTLMHGPFTLHTD